MLGFSYLLHFIWTLVVQRSVWAFCVIEDYVVAHCLPELSRGTIIPPIQLLSFQAGKERFRHSVVMGPAYAGEGLLNMTGKKKLLERLGGILCSAVTVEDEAVVGHPLRIRMSECRCNQFSTSNSGYPMGDDFPGKQVQNDSDVIVHAS